ncbi:uncharacterized protein [Elaeis guineensis]|uniref:uncharacterized protein isoform X2 n=1 Tax=Elaeis guineensis var. tenera TaxID=51953 RepID=UPI003C6D3FF5
MERAGLSTAPLYTEISRSILFPPPRPPTCFIKGRRTDHHKSRRLRSNCRGTEKDCSDSSRMDEDWMSSPSATPYQILGVDSTSCSPAQLKAAFRARVKEFHPDVCRDMKDADSIIRRVIQAYEILSVNQQVETTERVCMDPFEEPECEAYDLFVNEIQCVGKGSLPEHEGPRDEDCITNKKRRKTSVVWNDFHEIDVAGGGKKAVCNYCKEKLATGGRGASTSHLKRHSQSCLQKRLHMTQQKKQTTIPFHPSNSGCPYSCVKKAPHAFSFTGENGTARAMSQGHGDDYLVQSAVGQCPRRCIHYVTPSQRVILEDMLQSILSPPYDLSEADFLDSLIIKANFENNRYQQPKRKPKVSSKYVDWS